jgi:hypothetical protein
VESTEGLAKSASTSRTSLSFSAAIDSARLTAQNVLPSPGRAEQIRMRSPWRRAPGPRIRGGQQQMALDDAKFLKQRAHRPFGIDQALFAQQRRSTGRGGVRNRWREGMPSSAAALAAA